MPMYRGHYSCDAVIDGDIEFEAADQEQFEFEAMNAVRDMDPTYRNVEISGVEEVTV